MDIYGAKFQEHCFNISRDIVYSVFTTFQLQNMTGRKNRALQVPPVVPYKALEKFSKALYGATGGTCSAQFFRPVMYDIITDLICIIEKRQYL